MSLEPVELASDVHWIGALDPGLREFDVILKTANGTSYNAYCVRGSEGVAGPAVYLGAGANDAEGPTQE